MTKKEKKAAKASRKKTSKKDAAVEAAKRIREGVEPIEVTLLTGAKATLHPVSPALIQDVQMLVENPSVPMFYNDVKDREEENPNDPSYLAALEQAEGQRLQAVMDAQIMFGVELEPDFEISEQWKRRLKLLMRRHGMEFNEDDPDEVEFAFKKYGVSNEHLIVLASLSGVSEEDIKRFGDLFRG